MTHVSLGGGDRLTGRSFSGRTEVGAPTAMAATSQPLATQAALEVLRRGGHAVDAALAANGVLSVAEPMSCGPGGDLFAVVWSARDQKLHGLNACGRAPGSLDAFRLRDLGHARMPLYGPLSVTVPGAVDGWSELHRRFGRIPWGDLFAPAVAYARDGLPVSPLTALHWRMFSPPLLGQPGFEACWMPTGRPPEAWQRRRSPGLVETFERISSGGAEAFYTGATASAICRAVGDHGGFLAPVDLEGHRSEWVEPISVPYRGYDIWQLPPPTQGLAVLQMLRLLEGFDLGALGFGSADHLHLLAEVKKLVFEDRARLYADPAFAVSPVEELLGDARTADLRARIRPDRAGSPAVGSPSRLDRGDTVCIVTADRERNMVALMQSLFLPFGSGVTPEGLGFVLQNRGALFALDPDHPNVVAPGKRPFHTLIPAFVTRDGAPYLAFGVMGGAAQPQVEVQVLTNLFDFGMGLQEAGDAPRLLHEGSSEPDGRPVEGTGTVLLESGFPWESERELLLRGHRLGKTAGLFGGYQAILYDAEADAYRGASEHRQDGQAAGF